MSQIQVIATIGLTNTLPITEFDVVGGAYGSVGHATLGSSIAALTAAKIDLVSLGANAPAGLEIDIDVVVDNQKTRIFSGEYLSGNWDYDSDKLMIHCRDAAGVLVDQHRVLTAGSTGGFLAPGEAAGAQGIQTVNQTLSQLVTQIAQNFNLTPVLHIAAGEDVTIGSIYGSADTVWTPSPRSLWELLNMLANDTGNVVYVTPNRDLVFGVPGAGAPTLNVTWKTNPVPDGSFPSRNLAIKHNPRRNSSFRVLVLSYNPSTQQLVEGKAYVVGTNFAATNNQTVSPGVWANGPNVAGIDSALTGSAAPLYTYNIEGLTQPQANARALAIANDIAKREFLGDATIDGYPSIIPLNMVQLQGAIDPAFIGKTFFSEGYTHRFRLPAGGRGAGFDTIMQLTTIPTQGSGAAVKTKSTTK